jgi:quercetin dioxygenase-like cupin family protein
LFTSCLHKKNMQTTIPYAVSGNLERSYYFLGGLWTFLATSEDTGGKFTLVDIMVRKGLQPPCHTHTNEDETYYILEGEVTFKVGGKEYLLKKGDYIHCPKGIPHEWQSETSTSRFLTLVAPAGLEGLWLPLSRPADKLELPSPPGPPNPEFLQKVALLQQQFGIVNIDNSKIKSGS